MGYWGGQVAWIWLLRFVLAGVLAMSLPCSQVTRVDLRQEVLAWVPAWLVGVMGGREDRSAWGGWNCHVYPTQVHSRVKAEARATLILCSPSAGWSLQIPPLQRLNFLCCGQGLV